MSSRKQCKSFCKQVEARCNARKPSSPRDCKQLFSPRHMGAGEMLTWCPTNEGGFPEIPAIVMHGEGALPSALGRWVIRARVPAQRFSPSGIPCATRFVASRGLSGSGFALR